ncbi:hypothetical protein PI125_g20132 [Phytophthora idaei]|nr:hypothetical protein PI125_g20132 [Phytophthora idaei]
MFPLVDNWTDAMERACRLLLDHLQRSAPSNLLLDNGVEEEDNDDDLFFGVVSSHRYLARPPVVKTGHWTPDIYLSKPQRRNIYRLKPQRVSNSTHWTKL